MIFIDFLCLCGGIIIRIVLNISGKSKVVLIVCMIWVIMSILNVGVIVVINVLIIE